MLLSLFLQAEENGFIQQELGFVILLSIAALVAIFVRRFVRLPYTVALVLVGLILSFFPDFLGFDISSDLILAILVPPLIFEATLHIKWAEFRSNLPAILLLAVVGVLLSTFIVGETVTILLDEIPFRAAIAFGALISATDPVAVIAFFRSLGVSKRLSLLVEGESMLNDGVAIVLFTLAVGLGVSATGEVEASIGIGGILIEFLRVAAGGLAIGIVLGYIVSQIILRNVDDALIETATTVAVAFGSFVAAEEFHVSGILAVVAAGILVGNIGSQNTSPTTQVTLNNFWEFLAFVANSLVFLLIGLRIELSQFEANVIPILLAVVVVLVSRAIVVYTMTGLNDYINPKNRIPVAYRHVMFWGGLRGAISLALALTLTEHFEAAIATELQVMTFGVVLFTLLGQGTTISSLVRRLRLGRQRGPLVEQQWHQTLLYATQAGKRELDRLNEEGILSDNIWRAMADVYENEIGQRNKELRDHLLNYPELEMEMVLQAREDVLRAERSAITDAFRRGLIDEEVYDDLIRETDNRTAALRLILANHGIEPTMDEEEA